MELFDKLKDYVNINFMAAIPANLGDPDGWILFGSHSALLPHRIICHHAKNQKREVGS